MPSPTRFPERGFFNSEPRSELGFARLRGCLSRGLESLMPRGAAQERLINWSLLRPSQVAEPYGM